MPAKDLGVKLTCWKCGTKYYDLKKADPVCPKCGANPREAPQTKAPPAAERRRPAKEPAVEEVVEQVEEADLDEDLDDEAEDDAGDDEG
ncbi:MAG TPA: FYDLN acid domain-containing protein [Anaeromyxobacteraceae bacterium]|nr:FYDLN acid domain-containing protein [Anaeromyxobacteraceae bacterium]